MKLRYVMTVLNQLKMYLKKIRTTNSVQAQYTKKNVHEISVLPYYPKAVAQGSEILIFWSPTEVEFWGDEKSKEIAKKLAFEMDLELKATAYVKQTLADVINFAFDTLIKENIPQNIVKNALHEGYLSILKKIINFERLNDRVTLMDFYKKK